MPPAVSSPLLSFAGQGYAPLPGVPDEMVAPDGTIRPHWMPLLTSLAALGPGELQHRFATADRYLREAGVFYRIYGEAGGGERPLALAHMPLVLPSNEWRRITEGLVERAEVLETVLQDLYGGGRLIADGALPAAVVTGSGEYLRPMIGAVPADAAHLWLYAADLGRGPDGRWWVLGDRTQAPSGAGYAVENRVALSRAFPASSVNSTSSAWPGFSRHSGTASPAAPGPAAPAWGCSLPAA
jgi:uncharacterized circularly permuted ATP-grasp superfamily protein